MDKRFPPVVLLVAVLALIGCPGSSGPDITGKWYGTMKPVGEVSPDAKAASAMLVGMVLELELGKDGKFKMAMMGTDIAGSYKHEGSKVTLNYETLMGHSLKDANSLIAPMAEQFKEAEIGTVKEGGKTLFFPGRHSHGDEAEMTFQREPPKPPAQGPKSVTAAEEKLIGNYVYDDSYEVPVEGTEIQKKAKIMLKNMMKSFRLELRADNTFTLSMMLPMKGKWKLAGAMLDLKVTEPDMAAMGGNGPPKIPIKLSDKPGQLLMLNEKTGKVDTAIKRNG